MSSGMFVCRFHRQLLSKHGWKLFDRALPRLPFLRSWTQQPLQSSAWLLQRTRLQPLCTATLPAVQRRTQTVQQKLAVATHTQEQMPPLRERSELKQSPTPDIRTFAAQSGVVIPPRVKEILAGIKAGERVKLAEAITLVETRHPVKHKQAQWLLTKVLSHRSKLRQLGRLKPTFRIGLSGPPGSGKSTLIETFGKLLTSQGYKVAVLAVDPSSTRTGGSILGDKTRMPSLSKDPNAYIRPSPSGGSLGGVNRSTNEAILLCEGAGYDVILVETVGVGQSETAVCDMVDLFVLVIPPAAGDELQGMKKGIVELADLIMVNKADGDLLPAARRITSEYSSALRLVRSKNPYWKPKVMMLSAVHNKGVKEMWKTMQEYSCKMKEMNEFDTKRQLQQKLWLWNQIDWQLRERFKSHPGMAEQIVAMQRTVMAGSLAPGTGADLLLDEFLKRC